MIRKTSTKSLMLSAQFSAFTVVTLVYAGVAVSGFLMFGESTMSQFTLNLPQQYIPSKIAICLTVRGKTTLYRSTIAFRMKTTRC